MKVKYICDGGEEVETVKVTLRQTEEGVSLEMGEWNILKITNEGYLRLFNSIGESTHLQLDGDGKIKVED